ncbi:hypothetical protein [Sphingobium sp. CFD-2]|uniref:hypothetical protein n=1 Tax=Sphingobium sp. CFD-2 TaxID=2878542 RepID=UPI00214B9E59|nr:hypothetical protein [Sphingobium sp. CFD-2]
MRARLMNAWRRLFPHPSAIARRDRERAALEGRAARDAADRRVALQKFGRTL